MVRALLLILIPSWISLYSLDKSPWFSNLWEFQFDSSATYSRYRYVQNGYPQPNSFSNDYFLVFGLALSPSVQTDIAAEIEWADTPVQPMGVRSVALQFRYAYLNDLMGDPCSWIVGGTVRQVEKRSLKDVSDPYHANLNLELLTTLGREFFSRKKLITRGYATAAFGSANRGAPWLRCIGSLELSYREKNSAEIFCEGYFGLGSKRSVDINNFNGYGAIHHGSIDISFRYNHFFPLWGELSCSYTRRLYAYCFPEKVNFFTLNYVLPFSLF